MIDNPVHSLTFGDLVWVEEGANPPDASGITYRVRAQDATFGTAVPVTVALLWLGRVGGPVAWDSTPNREPVFRITVEAADSDLLARGEMALQLQCEQPTELTWTPPDGAGEPSVFDVVWSHLEPVFDRDGLTGVGMEETVLRTRTYLVRMQALPHARSQDLVVTPAQTAAETVVDDGSSTTGWSNAQVGGSLASTAGAIVIGSAGGFNIASAYRTGTVSLTGAKYLAVTWQTSTAALATPRAGLADGGGLFQAPGYPLPAASSTVSGAWTTTFYTIPAGWTTTSKLFFSAQFNTAGQTLSIDKVATWTGLPFIGTTRQKAMSLVPGGSVPTSGSIQVAHASSSLGKTIVYTHPSGTGYLPPLRQWRVTGDAPSADATLLSGFKNTLNTATEYFLPGTVMPAGRCEAWAWLWSGTTQTVVITSTLAGIVNTTIVGALQTLTTSVALVANVWNLVPLGSYTSPPTAMGPSGYVRVTLIASVSSIFVDEAYLFATDLGSLTVVDCGTGTASAGGPSRHLWIDAPTPAVPMGAIYRGHSADRSDSWHAGSAPLTDTWGVHNFDPRGTNVFVATQNTIDATTALEHYRRYGTYVTRED